MLMPFTMLLFGLANGEPGTGVRSPFVSIEYTYTPLPRGGAATRYFPDGVIAIGPKGLSESKVVRNVSPPLLALRSKMRIPAVSFGSEAYNTFSSCESANAPIAAPCPSGASMGDRNGVPSTGVKTPPLVLRPAIAPTLGGPQSISAT